MQYVADIYIVNEHSLSTEPSSMLDSILILFTSTPGDLSLQRYVEVALQDGLLTLGVFIPHFLLAAKSTQFQDVSTLDNLCRLIQNHHFASGLSPSSSLTRPDAPFMEVSRTVVDGLGFLRIAYNMPPSPYHALTSSASQLIMLLLSCIGDVSQHPPSDLLYLYTMSLSTIRDMQLEQDLRSMLENLVLSLSMCIGDDTKIAQQSQVMQAIQAPYYGRTDAVPSSQSDITSCSLLLRHMVSENIDSCVLY